MKGKIITVIRIERKNLLDPQTGWEQIETSHEFASTYATLEQARIAAITLAVRWGGKQLFRLRDENERVIEMYAVKSLFLVWPAWGVPALSLLTPDGTVSLDRQSPLSENDKSACSPEADQRAWWQADQRIDVASLAQGYGVSMEEILDIIVQLKLLAPITNGDIENEIVGVNPSASSELSLIE